MSKIGKKPVAIPSGVTVTFAGGVVTVKGPKGSLTRLVPACVTVKPVADSVTVEPMGASREALICFASIRSHVANMVKGVTDGFQKVMLLEGVGYRAQAAKDVVNLTLGFSHPIEYKLRAGVKVETPEPTRIIISGMDIEAVGQVAAELRQFRKPEPYKGKGVRYEGEKIRRKAGKAAGK